MMNESKKKNNRGGTKKIKSIIGSPIVITKFSLNNADEKGSSIEKFLNTPSADEQLGILKTIIDEQKDPNNSKVIKFLAVVFFEAPAKHPIKHFLVRHVTKCIGIQESFSNTLSEHIMSEIKREQHRSNEFVYYSERVPKIMMCTENFPAGALAVERVDVAVLTQKLFINYFFHCRIKLRNPITPTMYTLSPTEKNEIFKLEHIMFRLMVHVLQNLQVYKQANLITLFYSITDCIQQVIFDEDIPMDTKSLSGILLLLVETNKLNSSTDVCKMLLISPGHIGRILSHRHGQLVLYSAVATTVPMKDLQEPLLNETTPTVLALLDKLLTFAHGTASEPAVTEALARALLQLSRSLSSLCDAVGVAVTSRLLPFVWSHLDFHLDSVRHRTQQILANCLDYCASLDKRGQKKPLEALLVSVRGLGESRSFYWAVSHASASLGAARVLASLCSADRLLTAVTSSHLQAAASGAISALVSGGACAALDASQVFATWVRPVLDAPSPATLQAVLPAAIDACPALLEYIGSQAVGRGLVSCARAVPQCRALVTHRALRAAAIHKDDESRVLALSVLCERDRSTEGASREDLDTVAWFLRYNLACPRPALRTALVHYMNKLFKRLEDSHRVLSRNQSSAEHYPEFIEEVRALCYEAALRGASHGRRSAALQLLASAETTLPSSTREWKREYVDTLLEHLDDSYDTNKEHALEVLQHCPVDLLESSSSEVTLRGVLAECASLRAAAGAAAAVRLRLFLSRLPHRITSYDACYVDSYRGEPSLLPYYCLLRALLKQLHRVAELSPWVEAARGGAAGTLHCIHTLLCTAHFKEVDWSVSPWDALEREMTQACLEACARAEPIVAHEAPEGHMPVYVDCEVGEQEVKVTSQMVLVCAWRTIKEGSAVLSVIAPAGGERSSRGAGEYLVALLSRALHRGAVDQAAVSLHTLAHQCWLSPRCASFPRLWMRELLALVTRGAPHATRRGAGLPAAIQALVSSEVTATGRDECFNECMTELFKLATAPNDVTDDVAGGVARRTLAANILRALFRHSGLERASQVYVSAGLELAIRGFEAAAWPERTAMSLLFCALSVRVFGVARARGSAVHAQNTLPASLFFQRHPQIYDLMLSKLQEFKPGSALAAGAGVLPVLLVLARLYPSAVEGAKSSLKLSAFVPLVVRCACAPDLRIRRLAARALPALLSPTEYVPYIERLFTAVSTSDMRRNHWHGALLTLSSLIEHASLATLGRASESPAASSGVLNQLDGSLVAGTLHALLQATGDRPCYVVAREYVNVFNLLLWKFPQVVEGSTSRVSEHLHDILFSRERPRAAPAGRDLCLSDCLLLYYIILHRMGREDEIVPLMIRTLRVHHVPYEVTSSTLDYLLALHSSDDSHLELNNLERHLHAVRDVTTLHTLRAGDHYRTYLSMLREIYLDEATQLECNIKSLQLLIREENTQMLLIYKKCPSWCDPDVLIAYELAANVERADGMLRVKHMFLASLFKHMSAALERLPSQCVVEVYRVMFESSSGDNPDSAREAVLAYLERDAERIMGLDWKEHMFTIKALVLSTVVCLLEDDDDDIRERAADVGARLASHGPRHTHVTHNQHVSTNDDGTSPTLKQAVSDNGDSGVIASASGEMLRDYVSRMEDGPELLLVLALMDFRAEVCLTDDVTDESRVFDPSERYNTMLEESVWTAACADIITRPRTDHANHLQYALSTISNAKYSWTFTILCKDNIKLFEKMANGHDVIKKDETLNPKIGILVEKLRGQ